MVMDKSKNILIFSEYEWMRPFIKEVSHLIPKNKRITKIYSVDIQEDKAQRYLGLCATRNFRSYSIGLYKRRWWISKWKHYERKREALTLTKISILQNLAHEIAHVTHWDHTPERQMLENKIMNIFMRNLLTQGYVSEEREVKERGGSVAQELGL